jgi:hypothetical protein
MCLLYDIQTNRQEVLSMEENDFKDIKKEIEHVIHACHLAAMRRSTLTLDDLSHFR